MINVNATRTGTPKHHDSFVHKKVSLTFSPNLTAVYLNPLCTLRPKLSASELPCPLRRDSGPEMAPTELEPNCDLDVTISLVEKSSMAPQAAGSTSKKRRRSSEPESAHGATLGQVKVKASRLRQCSTYFDTCMSERWAQSKVPSEMKFHLEVHTEVQYYKDCFSRMHCLFKPIKTVAGCIDLIKVASQIGFQDVIDIGVKFLASTLWNDEEEDLVQAFCGSQLVPLDSLTELIARSSVANDAKLIKSSLFAKNLLTRYLQTAIPGFIEGSLIVTTGKECSSCRRKFEGAFHLIVSGAEPGVCASVVKHALSLLKQASLGLISYLKAAYDSDYSGNGRLVRKLQAIESNFCWLFKIARKANAAQIVVEVILDDPEIKDFILSTFCGEDTGLLKWARMMYSIFRGVLQGALFLDNSQRMTLFNEWLWVLSAGILDIDDAHKLIARFVTTFPQQQQEDIWRGIKFGDYFEPSFQAYTTWVSYVINGKAKRELTSSSKRKPKEYMH